MDTFTRIEKKYLLDDDAYLAFRDAIQSKMTSDINGNYTVGNLYYDTDDYALIRTSIEKPVFKEKLRVRSYGIPKRQDPVFIEIKRKYDGLVYKRRMSMPYSAAERFLKTGAYSCEDSQILHELNYFLKQHRISSKVYLAYEREAMVDTFNQSIRVTFDSNIRYRTGALSLSAGDSGSPLLESGYRLMEIKSMDAFPIWLAHVLSKLNLFPVSFSKYGIYYQSICQGRLDQILPQRRALCSQPY